MTLNDNDIEVEIAAGRLIENAAMGGIAGACYELRMGTVYYDLTEGGKRFALKPGEVALIKPGHRVVLITAEVLKIPNDILVRVVSKGALFSVGLSPVATYADPGFNGNLGIVTQNVSDKFVELPQGEAIAKADFSQLTAPAAHLYQGQHGFQVGIWPIKTHLQKAYHEVKDDPRVLSEQEEAFLLLPVATRTIIRRMEMTQIWTLVAVFLALFANTATLFLISSNWVDQVWGIVGNLAASGLIAAATIIGNFVRRSR
ncbi:dCTP deaminase domain-containing protein (plasmid) [Rhizobium leguminosarum]